MLAATTVGATFPHTSEKNPPRHWLRQLLTPWSRAAALIAFVGLFFLPTDRFGIDLCPIHNATGLPCPGCGMTRALAFIDHGQLGLALGANPFVLMVWPFLLLLALSAFFPQGRVSAVEASLDVLEPWLSRAFRVCLFAFVGFGVLRFLAFLVLGERFP